MKLYQFSILPFLLFFLATPEDHTATHQGLSETKTAATLSFPRIPVARWDKQGVDIAEDNRIPLDPKNSPVDGYYYVSTYGYTFANPAELTQWMSLDVGTKSNKTANAKSGIRPSHRKNDHPPTVDHQAPHRTVSRVRRAPKDFNFSVHIGPENYEKLIVTYSQQEKDHRTQLASQAIPPGYEKRKELGYLITEDGYKLLKTFKSANRLSRELAPVYQYFHFSKKDWILVASNSEKAQAKFYGYQPIGLIGYLGKVTMQPANCDASGSSTCPPSVSSLYTNPSNGRCYCKPFGPK